MGRPSLRSPRLWLLLAVSGAYLAAHVVRAARWRYLLAHLTDCGYWPPLHALTLGVTANNLLPVKAGLVARIHLLSRRTQLSHATVGSSMLVEALFDGVILLALAAVALALVDLEGSVRTGALIAAGASAGLLLLAALGLVGRGPGGLQRMASRHCPARLAAPLRRHATQLREGMGALRRPRQSGRVLAASLIGWGLMALTYTLLGAAFQLPLSLPDYLAVVAVAQFTLGAPPFGASLGAFEVVTAQALIAVGAAGGAAGAYVVALHALVVVPVALIALAVLWLDGRRRQREQPRQRGQQPRRSRVLRLLPHPARADEAYAARRYHRAA